MKGEDNKMDYEKLAKISNMIVDWEQTLANAKARLAEAKEDVRIAEKNLNEWRRKLDDLLKEERMNE
ncbi:MULTISPECIES: hypothetical protein [Bacillati]|uniref:hypothetical protein n=1 Tax=Bacillati TaxID=1783272 RepID=UPI001D00D37B|nr:hypothetical protein [Collinsella aerofaciens]MCB5366971.1 hypothetical protein [Collinsella aerofaciens]MCB5368988.1 hypothetical protein [Collinsella aerofaciens]